MPEQVNHPDHYNECGERDADGSAKFEAIKIIEDWGAGFKVGNAMKYICRALHKGKELEDLEKAFWYLDRALDFPETMTTLSERVFKLDDVAEAWGLNDTLKQVLDGIWTGWLDEATSLLEAYVAELREEKKKEHIS
jgi:hypothetical protein